MATFTHGTDACSFGTASNPLPRYACSLLYNVFRLMPSTCAALALLPATESSVAMISVRSASSSDVPMRMVTSLAPPPGTDALAAIAELIDGMVGTVIADAACASVGASLPDAGTSTSTSSSEST